MPPALFFLKIALAVQGLLWIHTNFRIFFFYFCEKYHCNFDKDCIESVYCFGKYGYFNNINSSNPWSGYNFSFLFVYVFSSVSFISVLQFFEYWSFTSLVRFIPRYFILFDAVVNGIVFLISLSDSLLLVYRNTTDLSILILYSELYQLMSSSSCLVTSLGFSMYSITSSANSDSVTLSFEIWISFISFSCLIAVARTANNMLNKSNESGHPCLIPDLRGNVFSAFHH